MPWQEIFGVRIKSVVFSFSLLIAAFGFGQSFTDLAQKVHAAKTAGEAASLIRDGIPNPDDGLQSLIKAAEATPKNTALRDRIAQAVDLRAIPEGSYKNDSAASAIKHIQANPLYRTIDERRGSNWVGDTMDKIGKLFPKWRNPDVKGPKMPPLSGLDVIFRAIAWLALAAVLVAFLYFAVRYWRFRINLQRRASAVLEEDEPERSKDEWLVMADSLEREGRFREAIRCLYLACLLTFDEAGVARFVRSHTNWEHLSRIQASPKNPGIDFTPLTKAFDLAWYGFRVRGAGDVVAFRDGYRSISQSLRSLR